MGLMGREAAIAIVEALDLPISPEDYMFQLQETCQNFFPACQFLPGATHIKISIFAVYMRVCECVFSSVAKSHHLRYYTKKKVY